jgi:hypothetical protein
MRCPHAKDDLSHEVPLSRVHRDIELQNATCVSSVSQASISNPNDNL